jgi:regulator of sigma E protease
MFSTVIVPLLVLGIIVVLHEFGHFAIAKLFKIRVETFSVGFGPRLLGFRYGDTDYRLSAFPLGGYVRMAGENPTDTVTGAPDEFLSKPKWQRFLVAAAGPAMNIILAVALLTGLFMYGTEVPAFTEGTAIIGTVVEGSPAATAGILPNDRILAIDGKEKPTWDEVEARVITNADHKIAIVLNRNGKTIQTSITPIRQGPSEAGFSGMRPHLQQTNVIERVLPGSPAETSGLRSGDAITAVNGVELTTQSGKEIRDSIRSISPAQEPFTLAFVRDGERQTVDVRRMEQGGERIVGIEFVTPTIVIHEGFSDALNRSVGKNVEYGAMIFQVLRKLVTREVSMKSVDGPIGIVRAAGQSYEAGYGPLIMLIAMISLNLGLMNLLPIPILDGGVMLLLILEGIRGEDLSMAWKERIFQFSFVFLLTLMAFVIYSDVVKLFPSQS